MTGHRTLTILQLVAPYRMADHPAVHDSSDQRKRFTAGHRRDLGQNRSRRYGADRNEYAKRLSADDFTRRKAARWESVDRFGPPNARGVAQAITLGRP